MSGSNTELLMAVHRFWAMDSQEPSNLFKSPAFVQLRAACLRLYPAAEGFGFDFALSNALRSLGAPCLLQVSDKNRPLSPTEAAQNLQAAFERDATDRIYLCPLDCADVLPELRAGSVSVERLSVSQLEAIVDVPRLRRHLSRHHDLASLDQFTWLVVRETSPLAKTPAQSALPFLDEDLQHFGAIKPHAGQYPEAVESALLWLLLAPWEDWVVLKNSQWRPFVTRWVHTVDRNLFVSPQYPPSADSLTWEPHISIDGSGDEIQSQRPAVLPLDDAHASDWINDTSWTALARARTSAIFAGPVSHFLVRAYLADGIDEFLAHLLTIEAAIGIRVDFKAPKQQGRLERRRSTTQLMAWKLAVLLGNKAAGEAFESLYDIRSAYLHGRSMDPVIENSDRVLARRLARQTVCALIQAAAMAPADTTREAFLQDILNQPFPVQ